MRSFGAVVIVMLTVAACGSDGPSRADALVSYGEDAAVPAFEAFAVDTRTMGAAVDAACAAPTPVAIDSAVAAVDAARGRWLETQAMWSGPVMDQRAAGSIDWTVDAAGIEELVGGEEELTVEFVATHVGSDNRGLRALRGVLTRDDAVDRLAEPRWCAYLTSVAAVVGDKAQAILAAWTESSDGGPPFVEIIAEPAEANDWLSMIVNHEIQLVRLTTTEPTDEGDVPAPEPAADRAAQLRGVAAAAATLAPLLGDDLDARLQEELAAAIAAYETGDVEEGMARATDVERTLTADVTGRLDVTIGFSDVDGDGSS